jgi:hypothetical protein
VAFAKNRPDENLAQKAHITKTMIASGRNVDAADRVESLLTLTQDLLPELGGYGVTEARLEQINSLNQSFSDLIGRPRAIIGERKRVNASLPDLFDDADFHLEQMDRFKKRAEDPLKHWKITDEDWRNRNRWADYIKAAEQMFAETSPAFAPWHVLPANFKWYARVKVLKTVCDSLGSALGVR